METFTNSPYACLPQLNRAKASALLAAIVAISAWWLISLYGSQGAAAVASQEGGKDLQAYRLIVERVHGGENYYDAAGDELRAGGYATSSVFNWRLPIYAWLLAAFPRPEWGQVLLGFIAMLTLGLAYTAERKIGGVGSAVLLAVLMAGAFLWCIDGDAFFSQELWAGVLIALSVTSFAVERRGGGVVAGLSALFLRELALPYVFISMALACREKRWREAVAWALGLAVFVTYFCWHAWQVGQHLTGSDLVESEGWLQFGGPGFVIRTSQMNVWLFNLPTWIALVFLLAALVGLASWRGSLALRVGATVFAYLLAFLFLGKSVNAYWGLLYVALLPMGLARLPTAVRERLESRL